MKTKGFVFFGLSLLLLSVSFSTYALWGVGMGAETTVSNGGNIGEWISSSDSSLPPPTSGDIIIPPNTDPGNVKNIIIKNIKKYDTFNITDENVTPIVTEQYIALKDFDEIVIDPFSWSTAPSSVSGSKLYPGKMFNRYLGPDYDEYIEGNYYDERSMPVRFENDYYQSLKGITYTLSSPTKEPESWTKIKLDTNYINNAVNIYEKGHSYFKNQFVSAFGKLYFTKSTPYENITETYVPSSYTLIENFEAYKNKQMARNTYFTYTYDNVTSIFKTLTKYKKGKAPIPVNELGVINSNYSILSNDASYLSGQNIIYVPTYQDASVYAANQIITYSHDLARRRYYFKAMEKGIPEEVPSIEESNDSFTLLPDTIK